MNQQRKLTMALTVVAAIALNGLTTARAEDISTKKADFAAGEKRMQDESKSSAAGPMSDAMTQATPVNRNKDAGKGAFEGEMTLQRQKPSPKVNKDAKAQSPIKSISKMTPAERAELRKEVVEGSKP
jgi:hypothetical protein